MHVPDGFVSPGINAVTYAISAAVGGVAIVKAKKNLDEKKIPLLGITAAFVFAAQMLNFPVAGGTSGHFLGAFLAALLLGPLNGVLVMIIVLLVQCLMFGDGGITALGTNIFNMGIVGGLGAYLIYKLLIEILPKRRGFFLGSVAVGSWIGVVIAAGFCSLELALSGTSPFGVVFPAMVGVHSLIGIGEALITTSVVSIVMASRPDLVYTKYAVEVRR